MMNRNFTANNKNNNVGENCILEQDFEQQYQSQYSKNNDCGRNCSQGPDQKTNSDEKSGTGGTGSATDNVTLLKTILSWIWLLPVVLLEPTSILSFVLSGGGGFNRRPRQQEQQLIKERQHQQMKKQGEQNQKQQLFHQDQPGQRHQPNNIVHQKQQMPPNSVMNVEDYVGFSSEATNSVDSEVPTNLISLSSSSYSNTSPMVIGNEKCNVSDHHAINISSYRHQHLDRISELGGKEEEENGDNGDCNYVKKSNCMKDGNHSNDSQKKQNDPMIRNAILMIVVILILFSFVAVMSFVFTHNNQDDPDSSNNMNSTIPPSNLDSVKDNDNRSICTDNALVTFAVDKNCTWLQSQSVSMKVIYCSPNRTDYVKANRTENITSSNNLNRRLLYSIDSGNVDKSYNIRNGVHNMYRRNSHTSIYDNDNYRQGGYTMISVAKICQFTCTAFRNLSSDKASCILPTAT